MHNITVSPVGNPPVAACFIFITDVTMAVGRERYLRDQQNARYNAVVAGAPDVILTVDENGVIQFANPAASFQFGFPQLELVGKDAATLFQTKEAWDATALRDGECSLQSSQRAQCSTQGFFLHLPGGVRIELTGGSRVFVTIILRDVNERRATDAALRASEEQARQCRWGVGAPQSDSRGTRPDRTAQLG